MIVQFLEGFQQLSLKQKAELLKTLLAYPALTLMVYLRRDIGGRFLAPGIGIMSTLLMLATAFIPTWKRPRDLFYFALVALVLGTMQRFKRWREFRKGVAAQHSRYIGTANLRRNLPRFLHRDRFIERFLEPSLAIVGGYVMRPVSPSLGSWLMIAGLCLMLYEAAVLERTVEEQMDLVDGMIASEIQSASVDQFSPPSPSQTLPQTLAAPLATGLGADIRSRVKKPGPLRFLNKTRKR